MKIINPGFKLCSIKQAAKINSTQESEVLSRRARREAPASPLRILRVKHY